MKTKLPPVLLSLVLLSAIPLVQGQTQPVPARDELHAVAPRSEFERRVVVSHGPGGAPVMEKVAFLGVETSAVSATLTAQLGLPGDAGLVVQSVAPDSPAAAALKPHDILLKLDDQLLIEPRQFAVLVRNHKEGDEVTLTYLRGGKQATAKVKLILRDLPKLTASGATLDWAPAARTTLPGMERKEVDHLLSMVHGAPEAGAPRIFINRSAQTLTKVNPTNSKMLYTDDAGSLELTMKEGQQSLVAKNPKGDQIFSGPVTTPEERKAVPPEVRTRLEKLEGMQEFNFKTGEDFKAGEMKIMKMPARTVALPGAFANSRPDRLRFF